MSGEYQEGVNNFRATVRKRESMRLKLQMNSAPGVLEKELMNKVNVEESVCQVNISFLLLYSSNDDDCSGYCQVPECL